MPNPNCNNCGCELEPTNFSYRLVSVMIEPMSGKTAVSDIFLCVGCLHHAGPLADELLEAIDGPAQPLPHVELTDFPDASHAPEVAK